MNKKKHPDRTEFHCITELEQVKALSHPLRMQILKILASSDPMTTKQVAGEIKEQASRLYHHVDLLEKVGLIRLTHTIQVRGATEKYFEAIARAFNIDAQLFADESSAEAEAALRSMIQSFFGTTRSELIRLIGAHRFPEIMEEEGIMTFNEMHMEADKVVALQKELKAVLEKFGSSCVEDADSGSKSIRTFRFLLAHFPLDRFDT